MVLGAAVVQNQPERFSACAGARVPHVARRMCSHTAAELRARVRCSTCTAFINSIAWLQEYVWLGSRLKEAGECIAALETRVNKHGNCDWFTLVIRRMDDLASSRWRGCTAPRTAAAHHCTPLRLHLQHNLNDELRGTLQNTVAHSSTLPLTSR